MIQKLIVSSPSLKTTTPKKETALDCDSEIIL